MPRWRGSADSPKDRISLFVVLTVWTARNILLVSGSSEWVEQRDLYASEMISNLYYLFIDFRRRSIFTFSHNIRYYCLEKVSNLRLYGYTRFGVAWAQKYQLCQHKYRCIRKGFLKNFKNQSPFATIKTKKIGLKLFTKQPLYLFGSNLGKTTLKYRFSRI